MFHVEPSAKALSVAAWVVLPLRRDGCRLATQIRSRHSRCDRSLAQGSLTSLGLDAQTVMSETFWIGPNARSTFAQSTPKCGV